MSVQIEIPNISNIINDMNNSVNSGDFFKSWQDIENADIDIVITHNNTDENEYENKNETSNNMSTNTSNYGEQSHGYRLGNESSWSKYHEGRHNDNRTESKYSYKDIMRYTRGITKDENEYNTFEYIELQWNDFYKNMGTCYKEISSSNNNFDIKKMILENTDILFRNNRFVTDNEYLKDLFDNLMIKYVKKVEEIFVNGKVLAFLKNSFTNEDKNSNSNYYLELLKKNQVFCPIYIANNLFESLSNKTDKHEGKELANDIIDNQLCEAKKELRIFRISLIEKIHEREKKKLTGSDDYEYFEEFSIGVLELIAVTADKLLSLQVIPIHTIISDLIKKEMDVNIFNHKNGRRVFII